MSSPVHKRRWLSFSLRRMMIAFAVLSVLFAGGRWYYVRIHRQERIAKELSWLGCQVHFSDRSTTPEWAFWPGRVPTWWERVRREAGRTITRVEFEPPFATDQDAVRVNRLLREAPHLKSIEFAGPVDSDLESYFATRDRHSVTVLEGLALREVGLTGGKWCGPGVIRKLGRMPLEEVAFRWAAPTPDDLRTILANPSVTRLRIDSCTPEVYPVLAAAPQLKSLFLDNPSGEELPTLGKLRGCEITILDNYLRDEDLRAAGRLPNLTALWNWQGGTATDEDVRALRGAVSLRELDLSYLSITDQVVETLRELPRLRRVGVICCDVTENGIFALTQGKTDLEVHCSDELDLARIRRARPTLRLVPVEPDYALLRVKETRKAAAED